MKRYLIIVLLLFLITGCNDKKVQQVDKQVQKEVEKKLPIEMEEEQEEKKEQEQPKQEDIIKEEIKKETKTNIQINKEEPPKKSEEQKEEQLKLEEEPIKEENQNNEQNNKQQEENTQTQDNQPVIKIVTCTMQDESTKYIGTITHTTTFEDGAIIYNKLYVEKIFKEGYLAEEDSWTNENMTALKNNTKEGLTGYAEIKNNITYLTINYDIKTNPKLIEILTSHTEYNDFLNNMNKNGYQCTIK